ncbi:MAG: PIN domain-containing protein [Verrucomicrobiota bacterium]
MITLIDSSAWIEATRKDGDPETTKEVTILLETSQAAMTEPVWMEVYRGLNGKKENARFVSARALCHWLHFDAECWEEATQVGRLCLRSGLNIPLGDILVFSCAERHGVDLLERDRHFAMLRKIGRP